MIVVQPRKIVTSRNRHGFHYTSVRATAKASTAEACVTTTGAKDIGRDGRPIEPPAHTPDEKGSVTCPDITGGTNSWPPSFDPKTRTFFVNAREACMTFYAW